MALPRTLYRAFPRDPPLRANVSTLQLYNQALACCFPFPSHCDQQTYPDDLHCPSVSLDIRIIPLIARVITSFRLTKINHCPFVN